VADTGSVREDLLALARAAVANARSPIVEAVIRAVIATLPSNAVLAEASRRFWSERMTLDGEIVERAIARGELPAGTDPRLVIEAVLGRPRSARRERPDRRPKTNQLLRSIQAHSQIAVKLATSANGNIAAAAPIAGRQTYEPPSSGAPPNLSSLPSGSALVSLREAQQNHAWPFCTSPFPRWDASTCPSSPSKHLHALHRLVRPHPSDVCPVPL
jgi:hypothetical protein